MFCSILLDGKSAAFGRALSPRAGFSHLLPYTATACISPGVQAHDMAFFGYHSKPKMQNDKLQCMYLLQKNESINSRTSPRRMYSD
mmetsp:Transcript_1314/g.3588  ORF Transcript_1314/g.3588 Transcript_1314/m.3588 type:complete len:86 (-) Transcript_1314:1405-1662(-)